MRLSAVFTLLCAIAAFILSMLCLFAGSSKSFLQNAELLTLNVSRLGHTPEFQSSDTGILSGILNTIEGDLENLFNNITSDIASDLGLSDFYSVHIMDYCRGEYEPNGLAANAKENVTSCSNRTLFYNFEPTNIVQSELPSGVSLSDIQWPSEIESATKAVNVASKVMTAFYLVGIIFSGLAILAAFATIFTDGRLSPCIDFLIDSIAFLTLCAASVIATVVIVKAVNAINKYGNDIGIAATKGSTFLGMTWAATAVMLLAAFLSIAQFVVGHRRSKYVSKKSYL